MKFEGVGWHESPHVRSLLVKMLKHEIHDISEITKPNDRHQAVVRHASSLNASAIWGRVIIMWAVPKTGRHQRVLNAAARVITGTRKFNRGLSDLLHSELHWLNIYQRVQYKLGVTVYRCLQNRAPQYFVDCCVCMSDVSSHQCLRSANRRQLVVPRHRRSKFGCRTFSVAAPMVWNSFPDSLRDPTLSIDNFRSTLKTHLFAAQRARSALVAKRNALYKSTATTTIPWNFKYWPLMHLAGGLDMRSSTTSHSLQYSQFTSHAPCTPVSWNCVSVSYFSSHRRLCSLQLLLENSLSNYAL